MFYLKLKFNSSRCHWRFVHKCPDIFFHLCPAWHWCQWRTTLVMPFHGGVCGVLPDQLGEGGTHYVGLPHLWSISTLAFFITFSLSLLLPRSFRHLISLVLMVFFCSTNTNFIDKKSTNYIFMYNKLEKLCSNIIR